ncbi:L-ascorbate oxidase [Pluteus cervinus]|uniref:L-ascorbate oxidase n=1 Tax=Pluteus cervinus TaxID=181527 RepID=A0ACD3AA41_9AGAR|nr:L-ascorbate oxidase [Pluteus cervinus]
MKHSCRFSSAALLCFVLFSDSLAYQWPSPQYDTLETLLYEGRRGDGSSLSSLVHPCRKRPESPAVIAAEWLRTAFHDMATHDTSAGTGGLDASIAYELDREENFGAGFNSTLSDYVTFSNKYVSRADIVALGAVFAAATCGGPIVPYQGGRLDAYVAGPPGVPEPQDDISSITARFSGAGFSQSDMITLTACGHTVGGVRSTDFPQLVAPGPNNQLVITPFDPTTQFDHSVVQHYLDGTTQNPLVIDQNKTMTSDLKIFSSDGNATVTGLANGDFASTCGNIFNRMINTVPSSVNLTDTIDLLPAKVSNAQLTIEKNQLVFKTQFRLTQPLNSTISSTRQVTMYWCDRYGSAQNCKGSKHFAPSASKLDEQNLSPVTQALGIGFTTYSFVVPIDSTVSISKFWFTVDSKNGSAVVTQDNGGNGYTLDHDQVFFVPTLSHSDLKQVSLQKRGGITAAANFTRVFQLTAAVRDGSSSPSRVYMDAQDSAQQGFPAPFTSTVDFQKNSSSSVAGYSFYTANIEDAGYYLTFDLHGTIDGATYTQDFVQTAFLDNTPYVAPVQGQVTNSAGRLSGFCLTVGITFVGILFGSLL